MHQRSYLKHNLSVSQLLMKHLFKYRTIQVSSKNLSPKLMLMYVCSYGVLRRKLTSSKNVSALVSVGGWTGSLYYSSSVATSENRTAFANALISFATKNSLDGLDFECVFLQGCLTVRMLTVFHVAGSILTAMALDVMFSTATMLPTSLHY